MSLNSRKNRLLLAVDIGNTTVAFGVLRGGKLLDVRRLDASSAGPVFACCVRALYKKYPGLGQVVVCSVVPGVLKFLERTLRRQAGVRPLVVGRDIHVPIKNNYRHPRQVGQDRLVGAYAAKCLYGRPCVIIDFGTAITFDIISRRGEYEGGIIIPGIRLSAESLFQKTALLPRIDTMRGPQVLIGKDTKGSILSGLFYGYGTMCGGLIDLIARRVGGKPKVIVTGGHTALMKKFIARKIHKIDRDLVFKGIFLVYKAADKN